MFSTDDRKKWLARVAVALAVFVAAELVLANFAHEIRPVRVTASAQYANSPRFKPQNVLDRSTVEQMGTYNAWALPDKTAGWIRFDFDRDYLVESVGLLNTRNQLYFDRGTERYHVEIVGPAPVTSGGQMETYPKWTTHSFRGAVGHAVVVHVDSFLKMGGGLNEVWLSGVPATGLRRNRDPFVAVFLALVSATFVTRVPRRWLSKIDLPRLVLAVASVALILTGLVLLRFSSAVSAFHWCSPIDVADFKSAADVGRFLWTLMNPIPPVLALAEIVAYHLTGSIDLVVQGLYRTSIIGAYLIALWLVYPSVTRMLLTFAVSVVFIWTTGLAHPGNPQSYDTIFPFAFMSFLAFAGAALKMEDGRALRALLLLGAGLALANWGLLRPFAFFLMPVVVGAMVWRLRRSRPRELVAFLTPVLLIFGSWHLHLWTTHGQLTMSNWTGFNLVRAWPMVKKPVLPAEQISPPYRECNNPSKSLGSAIYRKAVVSYIASHPREAIDNVVERLSVFTEAKTTIMHTRLVPDHPVLPLYRMIVRLLTLLSLVGAARRIWRLLEEAVPRILRRQSRTVPPRLKDRMLADLCLFVTVASIVLPAIGDAGEEARFLLSTLPLLALLPTLDLGYDRPLLARPVTVCRAQSTSFDAGNV